MPGQDRPLTPDEINRFRSGEAARAGTGMADRSLTPEELERYKTTGSPTVGISAAPPSWWRSLPGITSAVGTGIGFLTAGPPGAAVGGVVGAGDGSGGEHLLHRQANLPPPAPRFFSGAGPLQPVGDVVSSMVTEGAVPEVLGGPVFAGIRKAAAPIARAAAIPENRAVI